MLNDFTTWLLDLIRDIFAALVDFVGDMVVMVAQAICDALLALLGIIPVPTFLEAGLDSLFGELGAGILWVVTMVGLPQGLAIIGAGYAFRLGRKVATLFQW